MKMVKKTKTITKSKPKMQMGGEMKKSDFTLYVSMSKDKREGPEKENGKEMKKGGKMGKKTVKKKK